MYSDQPAQNVWLLIGKRLLKSFMIKKTKMRLLQLDERLIYTQNYTQNQGSVQAKKSRFPVTLGYTET